MNMTKRKQSRENNLAQIVCDNSYCEHKGNIARCYLDAEAGSYQRCVYYVAYKLTQEHLKKKKR